MLLLISRIANSQEIESLERALAREPPVSASFVEYRFSKMLKRPARASGVLEYRADGVMVRTIQSPSQERSEIDGNELRIQRGSRPVQTVSLQRVPQLRILLTSFRAMLDGRIKPLEQDFMVSVTGDGASWKLGLRPRDARVAKYFSHIDVYGNGTRAHCMEATEPDEDATITFLDAAELPALANDRAAIVNFCRTGARAPAHETR